MGKSMSIKPVSDNVIRRLPKYLRKLNEMLDANVRRTSSFVIADVLGLTASQVRQDLNCFGEFGHQGYGYDVSTLKEGIEDILGMNRGFNAIMVGVGNIGHSLADNFCFSDWGVKLIGIFDVDKKLIGTKVNGIEIYDVGTIVDFIAENRVDMAVLCIPKRGAKEMAALLAENGIEAIWNFTNEDLFEPYNQSIVENVHFSDSLLRLSYRLTERNDNK